MRNCFALALLLGLVVPGSVVVTAAETNAPQSWFVRVIVDTKEPICQPSALHLELRDDSREVVDTLRIPLNELNDYMRIDRDWSAPRPTESRYRLDATVTSCSGLLADEATLELDITEQEIRREIYVSIRYRKARPRLTSIETDVYYGGLLTATEGPDGIVISNHSELTIDRCSNRLIDRIKREYLVEGRWSGFNRSRTYSWPEDVASLPPGGRMTIVEPSNWTIQRQSGARKAPAEGTRYVVFGELDEGQYRILGRQKHVPLGLPGCNAYYAEATVTNRDRLLELPTD
jgi:hypothetical protein